MWQTSHCLLNYIPLSVIKGRRWEAELKHPRKAICWIYIHLHVWIDILIIQSSLGYRRSVTTRQMRTHCGSIAIPARIQAYSPNKLFGSRLPYFIQCSNSLTSQRQILDAVNDAAEKNYEDELNWSDDGGIPEWKRGPDSIWFTIDIPTVIQAVYSTHHSWSIPQTGLSATRIACRIYGKSASWEGA